MVDEELAAGRLTADDYRARRDQVLSQAVSVSPADNQYADTPQGQAGPAETQIIEPVAPPAQQQHSAEATQVVPASDTSAERTQVVSPWQQQQQYPGSPAGGFQQPFHQHPGEASPAGGFARPGPPQQGGWNSPQDASPPWGGSEFPPLAPASNAEWISQGPEGFRTTPSGGTGRKIAFIALGVVLVAGLGFGVWALFIKGGDTPVAQPTTSQQQPPPLPSTKPLPEPPAAKAEPQETSAALVDPAGTPRAGGGSFDLAKLQSAKFLPDTVIERLKQAKMADGLLKTTTDGQVTLGLIALTLPDAQGTANVAREYANAQQEGGLTANRDLSMHGVPVFSSASSGDSTVFRGVYILNNRVIIVDVYGPDEKAKQAFQTLLESQVSKAPPTERSNS